MPARVARISPAMPPAATSGALACQQRVGWQPSRFLTDRGEDERATSPWPSGSAVSAPPPTSWAPPGRRCARPSAISVRARGVRGLEQVWGSQQLAPPRPPHQVLSRSAMRRIAAVARKAACRADPQAPRGPLTLTCDEVSSALTGSAGSRLSFPLRGMLHRMTESSRIDDPKLDGRRSRSAGLVATGLPRAEVAHQPDAIHQRIIRWQLDGIQALCNQGQTGHWPRLLADDRQRLTAPPVQGATTKEATHSLWTPARAGERIGRQFGVISDRSHAWLEGQLWPLAARIAYWRGSAPDRTAGRSPARRPAGVGGRDVGPTGGRSTDAS
jgi:hypothetical protein